MITPELKLWRKFFYDMTVYMPYTEEEIVERLNFYYKERKKGDLAK
jgi:hypothetical protein